MYTKQMRERRAEFIETRRRQRPRNMDLYPVRIATEVSEELAVKIEEYTATRYPMLSRSAALREMIDAVVTGSDPNVTVLRGGGMEVTIRRIEDGADETD